MEFMEAISLNLNPNLLEISTDFDSNQLFIFSENRRQNITFPKRFEWLSKEQMFLLCQTIFL